jgi:hypothetical protein
MSFSWYDSGGRGRYRERQKQRRRKILLSVTALGLLLAAAYWWGGENVRSSEVAYKQQAIKLQEDRVDLEKTITDLRSEVQSTQVRYQQLEAKYQQEVPQGEFKQLTDLVKKQMNAGIKTDRLSFIIESARPPRNCAEPTVKRFVVKTPVYNGPHGTVSFGNGALTVTGEGASAVSPSGNPEAWYDPGKPVKIIFMELGGKQTVQEGLLPIQKSFVVGNKEYRFTVAAGERSFIAVTGDNCDYP